MCLLRAFNVFSVGRNRAGSPLPAGRGALKNPSADAPIRSKLRATLPMRIVIALPHLPFISGGAEIMADNLNAVLRAAGHEVETVAIPFYWAPAERVLDQMLAARLLDLTHSGGKPIDLLIATKFPAYLISHPRKVIWLAHEHRAAYEFWEHPISDLARAPNGGIVRAAIQEADRRAFAGARACFSISQTVSNRMAQHLGIRMPPLLHPPADVERFRNGEAVDYLFFPSRLCNYKRQELVLRALARTSEPVKVEFCGAPEVPGYDGTLALLAGELRVADRVTWHGHVADEVKRELYARCIGVVFPPLSEDYGYITLEAMLSAKPVITCADSGGPLEFVKPGETGLITEPAPEALATAMDALWRDRARAKQMGGAGRHRYEALGISWQNVLEALCA
jgi:glycosyltransferase involved in cell wall biosynthesis